MIEPKEAYPLTWPDGRPRTPEHRRREGKFAVNFGRARDELMAELQRLGARNPILSTWIPLRRDGLPYADAREPKDPGVAVYFHRAGKPYVIACDSYRLVRHNVRAVGATVEALRAIERHGSTEMMEQAFTGFAALPPTGPKPWRDVLGVPADVTIEGARDRYRQLARLHHPDLGGRDDVMADINAAWEQAEKDHADGKMQ